MIDSKGPPPITAPWDKRVRKSLKKPPIMAPTVASMATGPLKKVLNIVPKPTTSTICSQMPT